MARSQNNEVAGGFTHYKIIGVESVVDSASITAFAIPAGTVVQDICTRVNRGFYENADGASTSFTVIVGDADDDNGFITERTLSAAGSGPILAGSSGMVDWNTGAYFIGTDSVGATTGNVVNGKAYSSAKTVIVKFASDDDLSNLQDGELFIGMNLLDPASYKPS